MIVIPALYFLWTICQLVTLAKQKIIKDNWGKVVGEEEYNYFICFLPLFINYKGCLAF